MEAKQEPKIASDQKKRSKRSRGGGSNSHAQAPTPEAFRGAHKDLQGSVYTYDTVARAYLYDKTTETITDWVKQHLEFPMDV